MKIKIISFQQAEKLGLTNKGSGIAAATFVGKKEKDGTITKVEKINIKVNGEKELEFMSDERKEDFKKQGTLKEYIKQFNKIPENVKKDIH